ncbi:unnamed protein product [Darwinula stevensoni]|uniref:CWH43-like N-terminal domain-containing protein n=1 Tax=Darwinula stevensoni TaxID=69355 RepID=A0A7R9A636_9CRUS|nr:unnamed protein product [Darwinula stevensoni]CAG0886661.1 unnamed protein product [Darwinula stevensoni]
MTELEMVHLSSHHIIISFPHLALSAFFTTFLGCTLCLISAYIMYGRRICDTDCGAYNIWPSISAVTGVIPQRYFWRACVAFWLFPRLLLVAAYNSFFAKSTFQVSKSSQANYSRLRRVALCVHILEVVSFVGGNFIANKENYPYHEKCFIVYTAASETYMLLHLLLIWKVSARNSLRAPRIQWRCLKIVIACTTILFTAFILHRKTCLNYAFSVFSLMEYLIALTHTIFHSSSVLDFSEEVLVLGVPVDSHKSCLMKEHKG